MTRYRNPTTGEIWTEGELSSSLAQQITALDEDSHLRQDMKLRGNEATATTSSNVALSASTRESTTSDYWR
jgi:hypothetical protein